VKKPLSLISMLIVMMLAMPVQAFVSLDTGYEAMQHEVLAIGAGSGDVVATVALRKERTILAVSAIPNSIDIITSAKTITTDGHETKWKDRPAWVV